MIRFVKLVDEGCSGPTFNGEAPFIHWIDGPRSTNIWHHQRICFISDKDYLRIELGSTEIFKILDLHEYSVKAHEALQKERIHGFNYNTIQNLFANTDGQWIVQRGYYFGDLYVYNLYLVARSETAAEFVEDLYIDGVKCRVGVDIYEENEPLYVNMSNNDINIPDAVQKAIYPVNVHEDSKDNGVLNTKFKELLSNYWDIHANKGSFKSLYNSLEWFEWGDLIRMREVWSHQDADREIFRDADINEMMTETCQRMLENFRKTTYLTLSLALQDIRRERAEEEGSDAWKDVMKGVAQFTYQDVYDEEKNPELDYVSMLWSYDDLALKMCLLGNFYETYFMPIHLELIRCTIEEIVFTNTIKIMHGACVNREDFVNNSRTFRCSVKNGSVWPISNADVQVGPRTIFGVQYETGLNYGNPIVGCEPTAKVPPEEPGRVVGEPRLEVWDDGSVVWFIHKYKKITDPNTGITTRYESEERLPQGTTDIPQKAYVKVIQAENKELTGRLVLDVNEDGTPKYFKDEECTIEYTAEELDDNPALIEGAYNRWCIAVDHIHPGEETITATIPDKYLKTFAMQEYTGPGVAIPFDCELDMDKGDFIVEQQIMYIHDYDDARTWRQTKTNVILDEVGGLTGLAPYTKKFRFYLLFTREREVELLINFISAAGKSYARRITIKVINAEGQGLKLYKVRHKSDPEKASEARNGFLFQQWKDEQAADGVDVSQYDKVDVTKLGNRAVNYELYNEYDLYEASGKPIRGRRSINDQVFTHFRMPFLPERYGATTHYPKDANGVITGPAIIDENHGLVNRKAHAEPLGTGKNEVFTTWPMLIQYMPIAKPGYYQTNDKGEIITNEDGDLVPAVDMTKDGYDKFIDSCGPLLSNIVIFGIDKDPNVKDLKATYRPESWKYTNRTFKIREDLLIDEDGKPVLDETNHPVIQKIREYKEYTLGDYYYIIERPGTNRNFFICIAKKFGNFPERFIGRPWDTPRDENNFSESNPFNVERNDWGYIPQFHYLEEIGMRYLDDVGELVKNRTPEDFTFEDTDVLVAIPEFLWGHKIGKYQWGDLIDNWEWKLINATYDPHGEGTVLPSVRDPFIVRKTQAYLRPGYYDIVFRYRFVESVDWNEVKLDSAFIKRIPK